MIHEIERLSEARKTDWDLGDIPNPDEDFVEYVQCLQGTNALEIVRALLKTFDDSFDDGGTQEAVCGVLSTIDLELYSSAFEMEKKHLEVKAPEWLEVLQEDLAGRFR